MAPALPEPQGVFTAPPPQALPPRRSLPNDEVIRLYNEGRSGPADVLRVTTHAIGTADHHWPAVVSMLDNLQNTRHPVTGEPVRPDRICWNAALRACSKASEAMVAVRLFNRLLYAGLLPDAHTYTAVISACRRGNHPQDGLGLFQHLLDHGPAHGLYPDVHTYNTTIVAAGMAGQPHLALRLFRHLLRDGPPRGVQPNILTYNSLLKVCEVEQLPADALRVFQHMEQYGPRIGVKPDAASYACAIAACSPAVGCELLEKGLACGMFDPATGFDAERNLLDLHENAILAVGSQTLRNPDVHPHLAMAVVSRLIAQGAIGRDTGFLSRERGPGRLHAAVEACMVQAGWLPSMEAQNLPY